MDLSGIETEVRKILDTASALVPQSVIEQVVQGAVAGFAPVIEKAIKDAMANTAEDGASDDALAQRLLARLRQSDDLRQGRVACPSPSDD